MNFEGSIKNLGIKYNVSLKVIDNITGKTIQYHKGHNAATNSMLVGIGHYLIGDGVLNQKSMLSAYIPRYISLGTMGLVSQDEDSNGLPKFSVTGVITEEEACMTYVAQLPGFGADGYDATYNNDRPYFGLGPTFANRSDTGTTINCELISDSYPRSPITYREVLPASQSEHPQTIDILYSSMISTGALKQFRESGNDYIFISEAGLWSDATWNNTGANGLLAAYRLVPSNIDELNMKNPKDRQILKQNILRVGKNQVVQVIWRVQIGAIEQLGGTPGGGATLYWNGV